MLTIKHPKGLARQKSSCARTSWRLLPQTHMGALTLGAFVQGATAFFRAIVRDVSLTVVGTDVARARAAGSLWGSP